MFIIKIGTVGSVRGGISVIEEVDEQMTMTSMRPDHRPHVHSIFAQGPPPPSAPVDVPGSKGYRARNGNIFSTSAPVARMSGSPDSTDNAVETGRTRRHSTKY